MKAYLDPRGHYYLDLGDKLMHISDRLDCINTLPSNYLNQDSFEYPDMNDFYREDIKEISVNEFMSQLNRVLDKIGVNDYI